MKPYSLTLKNIDREFIHSLEEFKNDSFFHRTDDLYTEEEKIRIQKHWKKVQKPFISLKKMIRQLYWRSWFLVGNKNIFVVKYSLIVTYYNMVYDLRKVFSHHEEFLRQYLDDTYSENYSTLARFIYHIRFIGVLLYPREYFLELKDEVDPSLKPLFDRPERATIDLTKRMELDSMNIWYYIRYRISLLLTWISKYGWRIMMRIHIKKRKHGLLGTSHSGELNSILEPGDILLTRQNWTATNLNIPGFWKHMSMYLGSGKYLQEIYGLQGYKDAEHYIIEAIGKGVQIIPLSELTGHNDYIAALRPRFSEEKKKRAIRKAIARNHWTYDYSFNFYSDVNLVCSTLVTKSYLMEYDWDEWIHITLKRIWTGITYPPHDIVGKYQTEKESDRKELDFVCFIDARESDKTSFFASEDDFVHTFCRPRLSFFLP